MPVRDPRIDAYIAKAADFAKPILAHLRAEVHRACPEVVETIKWGFPHFEYQGILCSMASFKNHCSFSFWKASLMNDPEGILSVMEKASMGHFGKITSRKDLPPDHVLEAYIKEAMRLNEEGFKAEKKAQRSDDQKTLSVPEDFKNLLERNKKVKEIFEGFSYTNKKEYLEWFADAKTDKTRTSRMNTALEWLAEGKIRNWKYIR